MKNLKKITKRATAIRAVPNEGMQVDTVPVTNNDKKQLMYIADLGGQLTTDDIRMEYFG